MIVNENIKFEKKDFIKTYSDVRLYIRKVGTDEEYSEAIDLASMGYTYEETDRSIEIDTIMQNSFTDFSKE